MTGTTLTRLQPRSVRGPFVPALLWALVFAALWVTTPALAHEYWLAPSRYLPEPGRVVEISALAGTGFRGERKPFAGAHCRRLVLRAARTLDLTRVASEGAYTWASVAPSDRGGGMLAFESGFTPITLPAAEFDAYLDGEGLDAARAVRSSGATAAAVPGRERYRRCAKAWLNGSDASRATAPIGMPLELVPLAIPGTAAHLKLRVLFEGRPLAGALVRAWVSSPGPDGSPGDPEARDSVGVAWQARSNANGEVIAPVARDGEWLLSTVYMVASRDRAIADWESTWASLTFQRQRVVAR